MYDDIIMKVICFSLFTIFYMKLIYEIIDTMVEKDMKILWVVFTGLFLFAIYISILIVTALFRAV